MLISAVLAAALRITAAGDAFMVQGFPEGYAVDAQLKSWIASGDARLVNFEAVVNDGTCPPAAWSGGTWASMDPSVLPDFLSFGFNGCGCANNHSLDFSVEGLRQTKRALTAAGMPHAGIGEDLQAATAASFVETPARLTLEDGRPPKVEMLPIELHFGADWSVNGLPRTADAEARGVIAAALTRTSAAFGTVVALRADGIIEARPEGSAVSGREPVSARYRTPGLIGGMGPAATCDLMRKVIDLTDAADDQHNVHMLVDQNTDVPDRTAAILRGGADPMPELLRSARRLEAEGIEVIVPDEADQKTVMTLIYDCVKRNVPVERYPGECVAKLVANLRAKGAEAFLMACTELPIAFERLGYREGFVDPTLVLARAIVREAGAPLRK